ncbi:hypothetical protein ACFU7T_25535 [Streptomyces sp. NPDC057555]|uniref:hypothetical protein n=1 Tax=Streptomyces sp. NPDC057555 TaxID=3346166 RepID=UPI0036A33EC3
MEITARVRQSTHPHQGAEQARLARHIVLDVTLDGRLRREAGDALCRPATDFYELERGDVEGDATCRKCIERAARYGVRVLTASAPAVAPAPKRDEPSDTWTITTRNGEEIARVEGATAEDMTRAAEALPAVRANIKREGGFARRRLYTSELTPADTEQRAIEGVVVAHAGTAEGCAPADATHPDVVAARETLAGLRPATLTEHHDTSEPTDDECNVRGYVIEPRGHGRVALYWLEGGRAVRHDDGWHGPCLDILADKMQRAGWITVKMLRSSLCVFADRPAEDAKPAAVGQDVEQPAPAAPAPFRSGDRVVCGDGNVRTVEGMTHRTNEPARVVVAGGAEWITSECSAVPACLHRSAPRPDVSGDPIKTCARKQLNQDAGVFSDEGCVEAYDCAVQAANRAAEMNAEDDAPTGDPVYVWDLLCVEHRDSEQQVDTCEECNAAELLDAVEEAERADGTWRGGWIASAPADEALFDLGENVEQGALFASDHSAA